MLGGGDSGDLDPRATWRARRRIAYGLAGLVAILCLADIVIPSDQFSLDYASLGLLVAAMLLLLGLRDPR